MCLFLPIFLRIQLVVEFVDGVTRLELMKKADELKVVYGCKACGLTWFNSATFVLVQLSHLHPHILTPSHPHTLTSSHPHLHPLTPHTLTPSHPHTLIPSYPHVLTSSHPHTLTECITEALQRSAQWRSTLQVWVGTLSRDYSSSCHVILTPSHPHTHTV